MIERLNQITLSDFIELSCGNYACLLSDCKSMSESTLKEIASKLLVEYRSIVNPSNMKAMVMDKEDMLKERAKLLSLRICQALVSLGFYDDVRQVCAAMIGTVAFSLLFGVPRKYYPWCGVIGGAGWAVYVLASGRWGIVCSSFAAS